MASPSFLTLLWLWLLGLLSVALSSSQIEDNTALQYPLGESILMVFSVDKDNKVTMPEVKDGLQNLEVLFSKEANSEEVENFSNLLSEFEGMLPEVFALLDANGDQVLKQKELKFWSALEKSIQKGKLKDLMRDCFSIVDADKDDQLTTEEWNAADITAISAKIFELFPLRRKASDFEEVFKKIIVGSDMTTLSSKLFSLLDDNGDGIIQRAEVGKAYGTAGRNFLKMSRTIKQHGPVIATFGIDQVLQGASAMAREFEL